MRILVRDSNEMVIHFKLGNMKVLNRREGENDYMFAKRAYVFAVNEEASRALLRTAVEAENVYHSGQSSD